MQIFTSDSPVEFFAFDEPGICSSIRRPALLGTSVADKAIELLFGFRAAKVSKRFRLQSPRVGNQRLLSDSIALFDSKILF